MLTGLLLASCAHAPPIQPGPHLTVVPGGVLPPPTDVDPNSGARLYRVGPFDKLQISVYGLPELTQTVQVDSSGRFSLPLLGTLEGLGKTPDQLSAEIAAGLRGIVREPRVSVNVEETVNQLVTVDGQVREPGLYPVVGNMTLMRAIATAKGTSEFARLEDVVVFRTVGDQQMVALYNLSAIRRGLYPDPALYAQDVVVVGDSPSRRLFRDILQVSPLIVTPVVALLQTLSTNQ